MNDPFEFDKELPFGCSSSEFLATRTFYPACTVEAKFDGFDTSVVPAGTVAPDGSITDEDKRLAFWTWHVVKSSDFPEIVGRDIVFQTGLSLGGSRSVLRKIMTGILGHAPNEHEFRTFKPNEHFGETHWLMLGVESFKGVEFNTISGFRNLTLEKPDKSTK